MANAALELMGFILGLMGMIGTLVATLLPYWETSAHIGPNIITAVVNMKGLWMECVYQSTGAFQCETYNTILGLRTDLQAARAMMVISTLLSVMACIVSTLGMQCTVCLDGSSGKTKMAGVGGCFFLTAGFLSLIPLSWKTHEVVRTFYQYNLPDSLKFELGHCLYVGIASSLMSMLGGGVLCVSFCGDTDGARGIRRHGGGYPYPDRTASAGIAQGGSHAMTYRTATLQSGVNVNPVTRSHTRTSSQSTTAAQDSKMLPRQNTAAGYDVTGYV